MSLSPLKAIRAKCLDCSAGQRAEVRLCPVTDCPLYPLRMGRNPNRRRVVDKESADSKRRDESLVEPAVSAPERAFRDGQRQDLPVPTSDRDASGSQALPFPLNLNKPTPTVAAAGAGMEN